jgi:hypothetical protein
VPCAARRRAQVLLPRGRVALWGEFSHTTTCRSGRRITNWRTRRRRGQPACEFGAKEPQLPTESVPASRLRTVFGWQRASVCPWPSLGWTSQVHVQFNS